MDLWKTLQKEMGDLLPWDMEKAEVLSLLQDFFSVFTEL